MIQDALLLRAEVVLPPVLTDNLTNSALKPFCVTKRKI
jgi:hypothetical protein